MGLHTGEPLSGETGYVGIDVHRAARIAAAGHGGQILLSLFGETEDKWVTTECTEGLPLIASAQGHSERAARLFGVAEDARETFGITMPRPEAGDQEHFWAAMREQPERTPLAAAWAEGRAMTLEQAIEYALKEETG